MGSLGDSLLARLGLMGQVLRYFWRRRLRWMIPMGAALLVLGLRFVVAQATAGGPFIYALF